jgi:hypothetical protein
MDKPLTAVSLMNAEVLIHTAPLPEDGKVLVFIEANQHVTHVMSLTAAAARQLTVGLLDALDLVCLSDDDQEGGEG